MSFDGGFQELDGFGRVAGRAYTPVQDGISWWLDIEHATIAQNADGSSPVSADNDPVRYISDQIVATAFTFSDPAFSTKYRLTDGPTGGKAIRVDSSLTSGKFFTRGGSHVVGTKPLYYYAVYKDEGAGGNDGYGTFSTGSNGNKWGTYGGSSTHPGRPICYDNADRAQWGSTISGWNIVRWRFSSGDTGVRVGSGSEVTGTAPTTTDGTTNTDDTLFGSSANEDPNITFVTLLVFNNASSFDSAADARVMAYLRGRWPGAGL